MMDSAAKRRCFLPDLTSLEETQNEQLKKGSVGIMVDSVCAICYFS